MIGSTIAPQSFRTVLLVLLGALACVLAGIGVLGVASYSVAQRTREIGVRRALGARAGDISSLIVRQELPRGRPRDRSARGTSPANVIIGSLLTEVI